MAAVALVPGLYHTAAHLNLGADVLEGPAGVCHMDRPGKVYVPVIRAFILAQGAADTPCGGMLCVMLGLGRLSLHLIQLRRRQGPAFAVFHQLELAQEVIGTKVITPALRQRTIQISNDCLAGGVALEKIIIGLLQRQFYKVKKRIRVTGKYAGAGGPVHGFLAALGSLGMMVAVDYATAYLGAHAVKLIAE